MTAQIGFELALTMLWLSYYMAIVTPPGSPPPNFRPVKGEWKRFCKKCNNYKPPRTHHCKVCNICVTKMDHHCPWTVNCVGHNNMGHFIRFLLWVMVDTGYVGWQLTKKALQFYHDRHLPSYLVNKWQLASVILLLPLDLFVWLAILLLFIRCMMNWIGKGMTQIEVWEWERLDSQFFTERLWQQITNNYQALHGTALPRLTSWNLHSSFYDRDQPYDDGDDDDSQPLQDMGSIAGGDESSVVPQEFTIDDIIFPYDLGIYQNLYTFFNSPYRWLLPWTIPPIPGTKFPKTDDMEADQLCLPWPPDGNNTLPPDPEIDLDNLTDEQLRDIAKLKKRLNPRARMVRTEWVNDYGENLQDFGVDVETEGNYQL